MSCCARFNSGCTKSIDVCSPGVEGELYGLHMDVYIHINNVLLHNIGPDLSCEKGRMIRVRV